MAGVGSSRGDNEMRALCLSVAAILIGLVVPTAEAIECVQPPPTYLRDYSTQFQASALKVRGLAGPSVGLTVKAEAKNLLDRIPNADKLLLEMSYLYTLCTALRDDKNISEGRKANLLVNYRRAMELPPSPKKHSPKSAVSQPTPAVPQPAGIIASGPSGLNITGNSGPVVTGNSVKGNLIVNHDAR